METTTSRILITSFRFVPTRLEGMETPSPLHPFIRVSQFRPDLRGWKQRSAFDFRVLAGSDPT